MPERRIAKLAGMPEHQIKSPYDFNPHHPQRCAGMSDAEMREFMKEEQREGMHPSLKGKKF
jgi:hypothetical protein